MRGGPLSIFGVLAGFAQTKPKATPREQPAASILAAGFSFVG